MLWRRFYNKDHKYSSNSCYGFAIAEKIQFSNFSYNADLVISGNKNAGLLFSATGQTEGTDSLNAYYFSVNPAGNAILYKISKSNTPKPRKGYNVKGNVEELVKVITDIPKNLKFKIKIEKSLNEIDVYLDEK